MRTQDGTTPAGSDAALERLTPEQRERYRAAERRAFDGERVILHLIDAEPDEPVRALMRRLHAAYYSPDGIAETSQHA